MSGSTAHLQQKTTAFGDPSIMVWSSRTPAAVEWKQLEPRGQDVCAEYGRQRCGFSPLEDPKRL